MNMMISPPIAFLIMLLSMIVMSSLLAKLSFKKKGPWNEGAGKSYACGEDVPTHLMQPDYTQFFPFAFFFTILHVITLMITTVPTETMGSFIIAVIYILGAIVGLSILFRR